MSEVSETQPVIQIRDMTMRFARVSALIDFSLDVQRGEVVGLIGPTAAGKTVLLKILAGLYKPQKGSVTIDGLAPGNPALSNRVGMLFQQNALFDSLTIWENIAFRSINSGADRRQARREVEVLLPRVGLTPETAILYPSDLSGGMQKRVGFARAIFDKPDILLLDNPTAGLDPILAARIEKMIETLALESGATVISATGNMAHIADRYHRVVLLHEGITRWIGSAQACHSDPNPYLRQLVDGDRNGPMQSLQLSA
jgi:phospholipid/cholesterol/gamma-HCH transport system ATP-binding protein